MGLNKIVDEFMNICITELKNEKNRTKVEEEILSPAIDFILEKIKPYVIGSCIFLIIIILLILFILYLILSIR